MSSIDVEPSHVEYGGDIVRLLAIKIDGQLVSNQFPPFDASASSVSKSTCLECFTATSGEITNCGSFPEGLAIHDVIGIRRHKGKVVWFHQHDAWSCPIVPNVAKHHMWFFDVDDYETQLGGGSSTLPEFSPTDIQRVIGLSKIPDPEKSLYRIPKCQLDPVGRKLMALISDLRHDNGLTVVDEPNEAIPYEIGFERNCEPEVVLDVGITDNDYAFRLRRNPGFPLWITSPSIQERFPEIAG